MLAPYLQVFSNRRIAVVMLLGFASGLPLALTSGTLQAWMTVEGVNLKTIGAFTLVGLPYTWKFLWAPLMDRFQLPLFGRRRGWLIVTQLALIAGIAAMGATSPKEAAFSMALLALLVAFMSASQDIVIDAYRTDVLQEQERGAGAAVNVLGYRLAMLVSGALALIVAAGGELFGFDLGAGIGWPRTYFWIAALMLIGVAATLAAPEPRVPAAAPKTLQAAVVGPFKEFFSRRGALALLLLIILYKLGDAFALSLSSAFLIRGMQFSAGEVGAVNKVWGLAATIIGVLIGGGLMVKLGLFRSLLVFGILQAVSNLAYMWLALSGKSYALMVSAVGIDNVAGGMGTTAFVALLMAMCDHRFTATQYALLSALAAVGRVYVGPAAGWLTDPTGYGMQWGPFFFVTFLCALPGLVLLVLMRGTILRLSDDAAQNRAAEAKT